MCLYLYTTSCIYCIIYYYILYPPILPVAPRAYLVPMCAYYPISCPIPISCVFVSILPLHLVVPLYLVPFILNTLYLAQPPLLCILLFLPPCACYCYTTVSYTTHFLALLNGVSAFCLAPYKIIPPPPFSRHLAHFPRCSALHPFSTTISCGFKRSDEYVHFAQISQVQYIVVDYSQFHNI